MPLFPLAAVEASFRNVSARVATSVVAFVLGGAAMAKLGVKAATKDVDLVVRTVDELEAFEAALAAVGARRFQDSLARAGRAGARHLWETPDGMGWDLFVGNVMGFQLVESDYAASIPWLQAAKVQYRRLSPDLVFVMKAFTPRTRDIGDMAALLSAGAATAAGVQRVVEDRLAMTADREWLPRFHQGVLEMADQEGIDVRWVARFAQEAELETTNGLIRGWLRETPLGVEDLARRLGEPPAATRTLLRGLEARGLVRRMGDRWANVPQG